jgi:3-hydroxyisobutyrate dehydrogenase-like beta-hydroxyacid dehydrogenase
MCTRLVDAGFEVDVFDLDDDRVRALEAIGANPASSAAACASACAVLMTSLPRPDHVEAVMREAGTLTALAPGSLWIDLTTNRKELVDALAADAPPGVDVVDSPVTGAVDGARNGRLTLFVGGRPDAVARATEVLEHLGTVIACGPLGTGNVVKLVTNQLWFVAAAAIGEGFALGTANGVDLSVLHRAICDSVGDSFVARHDAPSIFAGHYDPSFSLDLCLKDLGLIGELQRQVPAELVMTDAARAVFVDAEARYGSHAGELHVARRLEDDAGLDFRVPGEWTPPWEINDR